MTERIERERQELNLELGPATDKRFAAMTKRVLSQAGCEESQGPQRPQEEKTFASGLMNFHPETVAREGEKRYFQSRVSAADHESLRRNLQSLVDEQIRQPL
jgi:hypothetical protein